MQQLSPEIQATAVGFLIEVGKWAMSSLKERWKLSRKAKGTQVQQEQPVELSEEEAVKTGMPAMLQAVAAQQGIVQTEQTLKLIELRRNLIFEWQAAKLFDQTSLTHGEMLRAAAELRSREMDAKIRGALAEIEADLASMGLQIEKAPLN